MHWVHTDGTPAAGAAAAEPAAGAERGAAATDGGFSSEDEDRGEGRALAAVLGLPILSTNSV